MESRRVEAERQQQDSSNPITAHTHNASLSASTSSVVVADEAEDIKIDSDSAKLRA